MNEPTRHPAVAESFYPSDPQELDRQVTGLLADAPPKPHSDRQVKALVVPHAGYTFSGNIAAHAYKQIEHTSCRTAILLGNAHAYLFEGIALDNHENWQSPLGSVEVNLDKAERFRLAEPSLVHYLNIAHHSDHVLEVQIPFLQRSLAPGFSILPVLFGENPKNIVRKTADILDSLLETEDLIIASSDLSHFPSYQDANDIDRQSMDYIAALDVRGLERHVRATMQKNIPHEDALFCGPDGLNVLLEIAIRNNWKAEILSYCNSGDATWQDREAVVGYGAIMFYC
ncbi:AmmeMemoRadiSam system protein B [Prosthecochloris sp. N3]|uniref:AmmeMemoRadiSam system protein B n=1 Tax=Prosthecochloris ethylica TaxID=2743976 RepID=A0ABR9XQU4_9CHLB|nr:AmmeMemoRadiSam system protein B [Prosthecochloris ethylica]MBF0586417.1 AmmeMemoRadiSam system protein B [Prosthecochloris ethylica]MBF0636365.1 AmmeMemoRadiSam system protein B [Prosthecochloris ethylica]NUK47539.1 AmmeMemoRadiSam system protein B [Prosthecochloris ethylica]